jgi:hypothetical protein
MGHGMFLPIPPSFFHSAVCPECPEELRSMAVVDVSTVFKVR